MKWCFFNIVSYNFLEVRVPYANRPTRDIIHVKTGINDQEVNFFVNHWPSRWGGTDKTEYKRIHAAKVLREYIDQMNQDENIIIMGDLNDYPDNKSVKDILVKDDFTNLMNSISEFEGSYNYKNNWGFLDHIIVSDNLFLSSANLLDTTGSKVLSINSLSENRTIFKKQDNLNLEVR